ncbi:MAG: FecR domain-containing protein [Bacteroidota bacterium]
MADELKVYNHFRYNSESPKKEDEFIEFLFQNTEISIPEPDEEKAWKSLNEKIYQTKKSFPWMKIAAAVTILAVLSISLYLYNPTPETLFISSVSEKVNVTFPDGSTGTLNSNSSFSYPEEFGNERTVTFTGEAYFDIKKNEKPFIIDANGVNVKVLGTAFNLITTNKEVKLYVDRGLVAFEKDGVQTRVPAGKEAIFNKENLSVKVKDVPDANIMSWRNGIFTFNDTPLRDALPILAKYYEVSFDITNEKLKDCKISATFNKQPLDEVLKTIGTTLNLKTSFKSNKVKISGTGC